MHKTCVLHLNLFWYTTPRILHFNVLPLSLLTYKPNISRHSWWAVIPKAETHISIFYFYFFGKQATTNGKGCFMVSNCCTNLKGRTLGGNENDAERGPNLSFIGETWLHAHVQSNNVYSLYLANSKTIFLFEKLKVVIVYFMWFWKANSAKIFFLV